MEDKSVSGHSLRDVMTLNLNAMIPTARSVWVEIPRSGLPDRDTLFTRMTDIITLCRKFGIPFVLTKAIVPYIDNSPEEKVPSWMQFCHGNAVKWIRQCTCQYDNSSLRHLHLCRNVFHLSLIHI